MPFLLILDSDSDNFQSLKKASNSKQNGLSKPTNAAAASARPGVKAHAKSPIKPSPTQSKTALKSPVTPKLAEPKKNPTSVVDYFGSAAIQRSDKKLVASAKRKAVSADDHLSTACTLIVQSFRSDRNFYFHKHSFCKLFSSANSGFRRYAE